MTARVTKLLASNTDLLKWELYDTVRAEFLRITKAVWGRSVLTMPVVGSVALAFAQTLRVPADIAEES